jgi:TonB family protein
LAFYFFPLLWPLLTRLRETSEMACDEAAVRAGVLPSEYARALARTLCIGLEPVGVATGLAYGAQSLIHQRLERLKHEGRFRLMRGHWLCLAVAAFAAIAIPSSTLSSSATTEQVTDEGSDIDQEEREEAASEEKTYTITLENAVDPEYPEDAKRDLAGGRVVLKLTLGADGEVGDVVALEEVEGYPSLSEAAEVAAWKWTFKIEGEPEGELEVIVPVELRMENPKTRVMSVKIPDAREKPDESEEPAESEAPEEPAPPGEPASSQESEQPEKPEEPREPEQPQEPDVPVSPEED